MSYHRPDIRVGQIWSRRDATDVFVFVRIEPRRGRVGRRCVFHDAWNGKLVRASVPNVAEFMELVNDASAQ